jgi:Ser/Thr protein kinase RdoA (MazF antagonist)
VDAAGFAPDGRLLQLNSYENRVHQVFLEDGSAVVTKFYRPGRWSDEQILEEHRFALELQSAEVPVVAPLVLAPRQSTLTLAGAAEAPPTLAHWRCGDDLHRLAIAPRCAGREPDLERPDILRRIGGFIGRMHRVGRQHTFGHRVVLDLAVDGHTALARIEALAVLTEREAAPFRDAAARALAAIAAAAERQGPVERLRLHGDCHIGNVLWRDSGAHVVDLDDACMGPAVQDLWMLVSGDAAAMQRQLAVLLEGYGEWSDFDRRELTLIEPLRSLRMLRHAAWLAERWHDPAFPQAFPFFGTPAYWTQLTVQLREQLEAMAAAPN